MLVALVPLIVIALPVVSMMIAHRRGYGTRVNTIVRCSQGHLFTTVWLPGASFKAVRLGTARLQRCPVGHHLALVVPVKESDLTAEEIETAREHLDSRIP